MLIICGTAKYEKNIQFLDPSKIFVIVMLSVKHQVCSVWDHQAACGKRQQRRQPNTKL